MSKHGEAWIESSQKRTLETALIAPLVPATKSLAIANRFRPVMREVDRSQYPGNTFIMQKLGDPESATFVHRWLRRAMVDELPQVLDIWQGTMTLIGPRADQPEQMEQLFDAIGDADLHDRWKEVRFSQKPGVISSYAIHSHRHNLEGLSESERFLEPEEVAENARLRATLDIADFGAASFPHDMRLLLATAQMAVANYSQYARNLVRPQTQSVET